MGARLGFGQTGAYGLFVPGRSARVPLRPTSCPRFVRATYFTLLSLLPRVRHMGLALQHPNAIALYDAIRALY